MSQTTDLAELEAQLYPEKAVGKADSDKIYLVPKVGENIFDIARKEGYEATELLLHNGRNPSNPEDYQIAGGTEIHLPYSKPVTKDEILHTELWDSPKIFYVNRQDGAKKYRFGNAKTWTPPDIEKYGATHPKFRELRIVGLHTLTFNPERVYQYYIHDIDVVDGVAKPCGFPKEFLEEGEAPQMTLQKHPSVAEIQATLEAIEPEEEVDSEFFAKDHYVPFENGVEKFVLLRDITVNELDGRRWQKFLKKDRIFTFSGTVTMENGHKFGILNKLRQQEDLYYGVPWNDKTVMLLADYDNMVAEEDREPVEDKAGQKYEVTPVQANRLKVYEDALFRPVLRGVATTHDYIAKGIKKINKKEKIQ